MNQIASAEGSALIPKPTLARELGISGRTLSRWLDDDSIDFPRPVIIRGRNYFSRAGIEAWKSRRLRAALKMEAA